MKRSELLAQVILTTGRTDKTSVINTGLNFGLQELSKIHQWEALRTIEGTADIPVPVSVISVQLPSDVYQLLDVRLIDPTSSTLCYPMALYRKKQFTNNFPNVAQSLISGRPYACYKDGNLLMLDRKSNGAYTIRTTYFKIQQFFSDDDECLVSNADEALIAYSTFYTYRSLAMYADAAQWKASFDELVKRLKNAEEEESGTVLKGIPWTRDEERRVVVNPPWLDPFQGHATGSA